MKQSKKQGEVCLRHSEQGGVRNELLFEAGARRHFASECPAGAGMRTGSARLSSRVSYGIDHQTKEQRDLDAFREDLKTENFKSLVAEALA